MKLGRMRLAVSNIAWAADEQDAVLAVLPEMGVAGVEIAPTMIWPGWEGATVGAARDVRRRLEGQGLAVPALQAILFARPDLYVFGDATSLVEHVARVAELAGVLGAGVMVFGSPRNRLRGELAPAAAMDAAVPVFRAMAAACHAAGTTLGIEANPQEYGGDFLTRWPEAVELVETAREGWADLSRSPIEVRPAVASRRAANMPTRTPRSIVQVAAYPPKCVASLPDACLISSGDAEALTPHQAPRAASRSPRTAPRRSSSRRAG